VPNDLFGGKAPVGALIGLLERLCWRIRSSSAFFMCLYDYCLLAFLCFWENIELELIQTQMAQKPMLRAEVGMRVRCANKASAE
jgi:hypothetical protein